MSNASSLPRFQFSLRWLLVAVTAFAVVLGLSKFLGEPFVRCIAWIVYVVAPTPLIAAAIYARGDIRAFAIGALVPWVLLGSELRLQSTSWSGLGLVFWLVLFGGLCGSIAVATRRWIERHGGTDVK